MAKPKTVFGTLFEVSMGKQNRVNAFHPVMRNVSKDKAESIAKRMYASRKGANVQFKFYPQ